ncbi:MAG: DUF2490 domain-containing protein [Bacteroidaceae bacterium]|nr:DUF2490 domain-containing protein [Bacteroidaceae bacterium]
MKRYFSLLLPAAFLLFLFVPSVEAQVVGSNDDWGFWTNVEGETKLASGLHMSVEAGYRLRNVFSATDRASAGVSFSYKNKNVAPWLKVDAGYLFIYKNNPSETNIKYTTEDIPKHMNVDDAYWGARHRSFASATASTKVGRIKLSLRERYQYTYTAPASCNRTRYYYNPLSILFPDLEEWYLITDTSDPDCSYMVDAKKAKSDQKLRSRLAASYDIPKCKFEPFAEVEAFNDIDTQFSLAKMRYTVGTDYKINKHSKLSAYYRYQVSYDGDDIYDDEIGGNIIGLEYSFDF